MIDRNTLAKKSAHSLDKLCRKRDLGHEEEHILATRKHLVDKVGIYLGLARTCNAVQKGYLLLLKSLTNGI